MLIFRWHESPVQSAVQEPQAIRTGMTAPDVIEYAKKRRITLPVNLLKLDDDMRKLSECLGTEEER